MSSDVDAKPRMVLSDHKVYIQLKILEMFKAWSLPWPRPVGGSQSLIQEKLYNSLFELAEHPSSLVAFVNEELKRLHIKCADAEPSREGDWEKKVKSPKSKIRPFVNPLFNRQDRVKRTIQDAQSQSSQQEVGSRDSPESEGSIVTPSSLPANEVLFFRNRTNEAGCTPPSSANSSRPVSATVSPSKRIGAASEPTSPSKRCKRKPDAVEPNHGTKQHSTSVTPVRSTAAKLSQLLLASRIPLRKPIEDGWDEMEELEPESLEPRKTTLGVAVSESKGEEGAIPGTDGWQPGPALPRNERAVLVLPANPYQATLDKHDVKFHIQWELHRVLAQYPSLTWDAFNADDTKALWDVSAIEAAGRIQELVQGVRQRALEQQGLRTPTSSLAKRGSAGLNDREARLIAEVDREEKSIRAGDYDGLLSDDPQWAHGGRISYIIDVKAVDKSRKEQGVSLVPALWPSQAVPCIDNDQALVPSSDFRSAHTQNLPFAMQLQRPAMPGKSTRLARRFGSRRVITFKYQSLRQSDERQRLFELFLGRQFVIFGRVYIAVWSPSDRDSVFAIEVGGSEFDQLGRIRSRFEPSMPTFTETLSIFNSLHKNSSQAMAKWASRLSLLFSDSAPALKLHPSEIQVIDDIVVAGLEERPSTEQILTDGCGLMTEALARRIGARFGSSKGRPFVVQIRLGGSKGLLVLMTETQEAQYIGKSVVLRKSMVKSKSNSADPSLYVIDVLKCGGDMIKLGACISSESIICLKHGGVSSKLILEMARLNLDQLRLDLHPDSQDGETPESATHRLAAKVFEYGGIGVDRKKRECARLGISTRVAGLVSRRKDSADEDDKAAQMVDTIDPSERYDIDPISGQPGTIAESLYMALESGFNPNSSEYAMKKLNGLVDRQINQLVNDVRIPIPQSVSAFIIPDCLGLLAADEIFCSFSGAGPEDPETRCPISHLTGSVLVFRSPCKLPTDIRKFKAVYRPELCHLKDCIVMSASSTLCAQSPASFLSGGDYDGDTATVIYDTRLVSEFQNADDHFATTPETFEEENFEKGLVKGTDFLRNLGEAEDDAVTLNYHTFLLGSLLDENLTGMYSCFHDVAIYTLGYDHPETIRLGRMFCLVLDARKSGLKVRPDVLQSDRARYSGEPEWKAARKNQTGIINSPSDYTPRQRKLGRFITKIDQLRSAAIKHGQKIKAAFPTEMPKSSLSNIRQLAETYEWECKRRKDQRSPSSRIKQLEALEMHASTCLELWDVLRKSCLCAKKSVEQHYIDYRIGIPFAIRPHPISIHSPKDDQDGIIIQAQTKALARVWREMLPLCEVDEICRNEEEKRIMLISCAAAKLQWTQQTCIFDVDFETTTYLYAKRRGPTTTVSLGAAMMLKPSWRAGKSIAAVS